MDSNSNDGSNVRPTPAGAEAQFSEQVRQRQNLRDLDAPLQQSPHSGHHTVGDITPGPSTCTYHSTSPSYETNTRQTVTKPDPVYLSPHHSYQSSPPTSSSVTLNECCAPASAQARPPRRKMGLSKTQRISILLGIDSAFFLVELVVGKWNISARAQG